jgi:hypothetical protein
MDDRQVERELSYLFSESVADEDFAALADKVWKRNKRQGSYLNYAVAGATLVGCAVSYLVADSVGLVNAIASNLDISAPANGSQVIVAAGMLVTLLASFWIAKLASER